MAMFGGASERLAFILQLDANGAIQGFRKVADTAERELGRADDRLDRIGGRMQVAGAGAMAFAGVAGRALFGFAGAAEEAQRSQLLLQNTLDNMPALAGETVDSFNDLANAIQDKTAADGDQIVSAMAMLGTFQVTGDQIRSIIPLVVDYSRKFGVDMVDAAIQVGKALNGQIGVLQRNGVTIDAAAYAADRFTAVQQALREQVGGFAEAEGATFSGQLERLKNQLGDVAEGIGGGVVQAFSQMMGAVDPLIDAFKDLDPATQSTIGQFAAFGTVAVGLAGAASFAAGSVLKMADNFGRMRAAIADRGGLLSMVGRLSPAILGVGAALGVAAVALNDYNKTKAEAARLTDAFVQALADEEAGVEGATAALTAHELATSRIGDLLTDLGADYDLLTTGVREQGEALEYLDGQVGAISNGYVTLEEAIAAAGLSGTALGAELLRLGENMSMPQLASLIDQLDGLSDRHDDATRTAGNVSAAEEQLGVSIDATTGAVIEQDEAIRSVNDRLEENRQRNEEAREAIEDRTEAIRAAIGGDIAYRDAVRDTNSALEEYATAASDGSLSADELAAAQDEAADAAIDQSNAAVELARQTAEAAGAQLTAAEAAQVQRDELQRVADTLAPGSPLRVQLEGYIGQLNAIPREVSTRLSVQYAQGSLPLPAAGTGPRAFAAGGRPKVGEVAVVGEQGPELFVPDTSGTIVPNHRLGAPGAAGPLVSVTVHVAGSVWAERDLADVIQRQFVLALQGNPRLAFMR